MEAERDHAVAYCRCYCCSKPVAAEEAEVLDDAAASKKEGASRGNVPKGVFRREVDPDARPPSKLPPKRESMAQTWRPRVDELLGADE